MLSAQWVYDIAEFHVRLVTINHLIISGMVAVNGDMV